MKSISRVISVLGMVIISLTIGAGCAQEAETDKSDNILDYYYPEPGWSLAYDFVSQHTPGDDGKVIVIFQNPPQDNEISFYYSAPNWGFGICHWKSNGEIIGASPTISVENKYSGGGFRYVFMINMPIQFENDMDYTIDNINYHVTTGERWNSYSDCIKISFDSPDGWGPPWELGLLGGTGYFYLAKNIGLVHLYFKNRATEDIETFSLAEPPKRIEQRHISGHIQNSAGNPLEGIYVSLDNQLALNWWGKTDAAGNYSFDFYCENDLFHGGFLMGYDENTNNILDNDEVKISSNYCDFTNINWDIGTYTWPE